MHMKAQGRKKKVITPVSGAIPVEVVENAFGSRSYSGVEFSSRNAKNRSLLTIGGSARFALLRDGLSPFQEDSTGVGAYEAIYLCQKAYWNVPIFKQTIDIMSEFSNSEVRWEGGNKASRDFFQALWEKIGFWKLRDQFFREYYRSGNIFMLRFDGSLSKQDAKKLTQVYPEDLTMAASNTVLLPLRYVFLNPLDIRAGASISFAANNIYHKVLNKYEIERLRNPQTAEEKEMFDSLNPEQKKAIKKGDLPAFPIDSEKLHVVFYKDMDYEPLATPMGFCVLDDIETKLEMKKADRIALRATESIILSITMGAEPEKGGMNPAALEAMQEIFAHETVGRVIVSDYTTKMDFIIPDLNKVLGPEKYQIVNEDIANGLNNIFWGEQKFANAMVKIKVFIERMTDAQDAFTEKFLKPEVRRIAKIMGFKSYPLPIFRKIDINDDIEVAKMVTQLGMLGILTGEQTIDAIRTGFLPNMEDTDSHQEKYRDQRQKGMFAPLSGPMPLTMDQQKEQKSADQQHQLSLKQAGRPKGTKAKQKTKKVKPIGTGATTFTFSKIKDCVLATDKIITLVEAKLKKKHKIKELDDKQIEAAQSLAQSIVQNEPREKWENSIDAYLKGPQEINREAATIIEDIAFEHQVSHMAATILYHSRR